jgi:hypothetical protein
MRVLNDLEEQRLLNRFRAELKELVKRRPELCEGEGNWSDDLPRLERAMATPTKDRMAQYRSRQREKGLKAVTVFLTTEAQERLNTLMAERPDATMGEIISEALKEKEQPA